MCRGFFALHFFDPFNGFTDDAVSAGTGFFVLFFALNGVNSGSGSVGSTVFCFRIGDRTIVVPERRNDIFFFTVDIDRELPLPVTLLPPGLC
jgi:hypothetical protein